MIIKVQARVRGLIVRNKIRATQSYGNMMNSPGYGQLDHGMN